MSWTHEEYSFRFGPGVEYDLNQEVAPGITIRDITRDDCFDNVE